MGEKIVLHKWLEENLFAPARSIFEEQKSGKNVASSEFEEDEPETIKNTEEEPIPPTLRSAGIENMVEQANTVSEIRIAVAESLEERVNRLENENTKLKEENEKLKKLAINDHLTGLHSKMYFDETLDREIAASLRHKTDLSLIIIDLDKFKWINDKLGHAAGDEALKLVGGIVNSTMRPEDIKCRYGGEELAVIMPGISKEGAGIAAERLRAVIEDMLKPHLLELYPDKKEMVEAQRGTASIGVTTFSAHKDDESLERKSIVKRVFDQADEALYEAKNNGRNQVQIFGIKAPKSGTEKKVNGKLLKATLENPAITNYATQMKEDAEAKIPEPELREEALRMAADQIRNERLGKKVV